ncbi:glycosyltransferase [Pararhizobium mangrovi]|uniref:Glycosyltransferase family 2 protein n=1 Tax=Pararhizobium mangrovi TaxID=2590452 RepID=A0A506U1E6_9HYPH|nr:glycosyltransferase [Pararhizobium mangrovi]TPW28173.1 glycosyltransferase family 2 protein [Pararhizobium mangrovi]
MSIRECVAAYGGHLLAPTPGKSPGSARIIVCVPVRNEADRVGRCLKSLSEAFGAEAHVLLLVNDTDDGTQAAIEAASSRLACGITVVDVGWRNGCGSAGRARLLAMAIAHRLAPGAILYSTDADTLVAPDTMTVLDGHFAEGFDLVCGRIGFIAEEAALLEAVDPARDAAIRAYRETTRHIAALLFPDPDNPWPHHGNIGGANFAITADAYRRIAPLPVVASGEDRLLRRHCEAHGMRITYSNALRVETSCRLDGFTQGGLSAELTRNRHEADPEVDEMLERPSELLRRLRLRYLMEHENDRQRVAKCLAARGMTPEHAARLADLEPRTLAWLRVENELACLRRERLRFSAMKRYLPGLERLHRRIEEASRDRPPARAR